MLERVIDILEAAQTAGPVSEERVSEAEQALGVRFPAAYREFLLRFGAALGQGWEINGIDASRTSEEEPPLYQYVAQQALRDRQRNRGRLPRTLIEVAHDGMELGFYLDLSAESDGDCPVLGLGPGVDLLRAAPTFVDFVVGWARDQLAEFPARHAGKSGSA